jgi:hypothetical protein
MTEPPDGKTEHHDREQQEDDAELESLYMGVWRIKDLCKEEKERRLEHGALPRPPRKAANGN